MDTNRHEGFRREAALECGGPPVDEFGRGESDAAFGSQTPCSEVLVSFGVFGG